MKQKNVIVALLAGILLILGGILYTNVQKEETATTQDIEQSAKNLANTTLKTMEEGIKNAD